MKQILINIKDNSKFSFFLQLIKQFDFLEIKEINSKQKSSKHDFFGSAGLWKNREINSSKLREKAWKREG
ncbi:MAG: hypothetical protein K9G67_08040 [Bacteroidales bacterium]|nr:hypothetical protein [Bacteroidales bacterium]MCF8345284.1 hypothetical protein [Bacteroidales bacterium]MCF8349770.1 hypothetical protein [Bacteroidales bacterium]MCF8376289.1 hypothetical protein [Bacteroidales bacterium]